MEPSSEASERAGHVLQLADVPLGNIINERELKKAIRYRKKSPSYQAKTDAQVGDILTSMMETAKINSLSPVRYLQTLLENWNVPQSEPATWLRGIYVSITETYATRLKNGLLCKKFTRSTIIICINR